MPRGTVAAAVLLLVASISRADVRSLRHELLTGVQKDVELLRASVWDFWACHGVDQAFGGFHGTSARNGSAIQPDTKGIVQQTRHTWAFSTYYQHGYNTMPASDGSATCIKSTVLPNSQAMASAAYNFVVKHMHDPADDMFYWAVNREGNTVTQPAKAIYGQWFVLYGFSAYYAAFRDQHARQLALDCFEALDAAWHNSSTGGYNEWMSNVIPPDPGEPPFEVDPATPLPRTLNVMMHGLEALTALHRVTNDPVVLTRVLEYLSILCTKLQRVGGLLYEAYTPGAAEELWLPAPKYPEIKFWNSINYGHNLESTWLVADTLDYLLSTAAIEPALADTYRSAAMAVGEAAVKVAYDGKYGGVYESGQPDTGPTSTAKAWWTQAESIMALWRVFKHFNNMQYLEKLAATVKFILSYIDDSEYGEQYTQVQADGSHTTEWDTDYYKSTKGNKWKASYHDSRALLFLQNWMKDDMVL